MKKLTAYFLSALLLLNFTAHAQIINPAQPTTAGTGLNKSGTALSVIYGTTSGTSTQGNDIRFAASAGSVGQVLTSNGIGVAPSYQAGGSGAVSSVFGQTGAVPDLSGDVTTSGSSVVTLGTVSVTKGGTGTIALTAHGVIIGAGASAVNITSAGTSGQVLTSNGASSDPTFQTLPSGTVTNGGTGASSFTAHAVLIGNSTSAIQTAGPGTSGQVLTSNGASSDPTFQASPSGLTLIQSQDAATSATIEFTTSIDSAYSEYELHVINAVCDANGQNFLMRVSTDGGSTWASGSSDYGWGAADLTSVFAINTGGSTGTSAIRLNVGAPNNTVANQGWSGVIKIWAPTNTQFLQISYSGTYYSNTASAVVPINGGGQYLTASAVNGLQLFFGGSNNISTGSFKLYGVKK